MYRHAALTQRPNQGDKMTAEEVSSDYFGGKISPYTVRDLWRRGELPGCKLGRLIFSRAELDRFFAERSRANVERQKTPEYGKIRAVSGE